MKSWMCQRVLFRRHILASQCKVQVNLKKKAQPSPCKRCPFIHWYTLNVSTTITWMYTYSLCSEEGLHELWSSLIFHCVASSSQLFHFCNTTVYDQIAPKLMIFTSSTARTDYLSNMWCVQSVKSHLFNIVTISIFRYLVKNTICDFCDLVLALIKCLRGDFKIWTFQNI